MPSWHHTCRVTAASVGLGRTSSISKGSSSANNGKSSGSCFLWACSSYPEATFLPFVEPCRHISCLHEVAFMPSDQITQYTLVGTDAISAAQHYCCSPHHYRVAYISQHTVSLLLNTSLQRLDYCSAPHLGGSLNRMLLMLASCLDLFCAFSLHRGTAAPACWRFAGTWGVVIPLVSRRRFMEGLCSRAGSFCPRRIVLRSGLICLRMARRRHRRRPCLHGVLHNGQ